MLAGLAGAEPERAALGAAGALGMYRRAGQGPETGTAPALEPSTAADLPRCSPRARQFLERILDGEYGHLLGEWLGALAAAGGRVPEESLVALLEMGRARSGMQEAITAVLGARGRWLAAQNPDWRYALTTPDAANWETAGLMARVGLLRQVRATDPARGRELLLSTWEHDPAEARKTLLPLLESGLSLEDEPFLEETLDDRSKDVRAAAADLLARLPESRLVRRMTDRVRAYLSFNPPQKGRLLKGGQKMRLEITLPDAVDAAAQRDGIDPKEHYGSGKKTGWLRQMLALVPPSTWSTEWNQPPTALIEVAQATEWDSLLLTGWAAAAERYGDHAWAGALLGLHEKLPDEHRRGLLRLAPPAEREAYILHLLGTQAGPLRSNHPARSLLPACAQPWSPDFTLAYLARLHPTIWGKLPAWEAASALEEVAGAMPPALIPKIVVGWPGAMEDDSSAQETIAAFHALAQFRYEMLVALGGV
jgi:hypothetical protein